MLRTPFSGGGVILVTQKCQSFFRVEHLSLDQPYITSNLAKREYNSRDIMKLHLAVIAASEAKLVNFSFPDPLKGKHCAGVNSKPIDIHRYYYALLSGR